MKKLKKLSLENEMKKIINRPEDVVNEMCSGIVLAHPELKLNSKYRFIRKKELGRGKVSLISGGGSGHEPAHVGFVGTGLLDAAVCGDVFASPSQIQVYQAIRETASEAGTLLIIKNYSGDMMNFSNAAHMAREDGIEVEFVKVDDDIAVQDSLYTVGRRGVAGTIFVHKIAGAAAAQHKPLSEVKAAAEKVVANVRSIGFALTSCTVPAKGAPTFALGEDELEYGVGIHGEPGIRRESVIQARELAGRMVLSLCSELNLKHGTGGEVALLVNGFGASPLMELYLLSFEATRELAARGIQVVRTFVGNFMTSIDMAGASISLLKLDDELKNLLDEPCASPALNIAGPVEPVPFRKDFQDTAGTKDVSYTVETPRAYAAIEEVLTLNNMEYLVDVMSESIIQNEVSFCELDSFAGDGDFRHAARNSGRLVGHRLHRRGPHTTGLPLRKGIPLLLAHSARSLSARRPRTAGRTPPAADDLAGGLRQGLVATRQPAGDPRRTPHVRRGRLEGRTQRLQRDGLGCRAHCLSGAGLLRDGLPHRRGGLALHRTRRHAGA